MRDPKKNYISSLQVETHEPALALGLGFGMLEVSWVQKARKIRSLGKEKPESSLETSLHLLRATWRSFCSRDLAVSGMMPEIILRNGRLQKLCLLGFMVNCLAIAGYALGPYPNLLGPCYSMAWSHGQKSLCKAEKPFNTDPI